MREGVRKGGKRGGKEGRGKGRGGDLWGRGHGGKKMQKASRVVSETERVEGEAG